MRVLVVEDNRDMAANIGLYLEQHGHVVDFASDGNTGQRMAMDQVFDAVVLDLGLPGKDGDSVCQYLREEAGIDTPILMLTARDTLDDKLNGFSSGADDYLVKPAPLQELLARLESLHRRNQGSVSKRDLEVDGLVYRHDTGHFSRAGQDIELQPVASKILLLLMRSANKLVKRETVEYEIWKDDLPDGDPLRVHIHAIRAAIDKPYDQKLLQTIRGSGYRLGSGSE